MLVLSFLMMNIILDVLTLVANYTAGTNRKKPDMMLSITG